MPFLPAMPWEGCAVISIREMFSGCLLVEVQTPPAATYHVNENELPYRQGMGGWWQEPDCAKLGAAAKKTVTRNMCKTIARIIGMPLHLITNHGCRRRNKHSSRAILFAVG
jgi:hypothetical protein